MRTPLFGRVRHTPTIAEEILVEARRETNTKNVTPKRESHPFWFKPMHAIQAFTGKFIKDETWNKGFTHGLIVGLFALGGTEAIVGGMATTIVAFEHHFATVAHQPPVPVRPTNRQLLAKYALDICKNQNHQDDTLGNTGYDPDTDDAMNLKFDCVTSADHTVWTPDKNDVHI